MKRVTYHGPELPKTREAGFMFLNQFKFTSFKELEKNLIIRKSL